MERTEPLAGGPSSAAWTPPGGGTPEDLDPAAARAFREFREAAVRLAEGIDDLQGVEPDRVAAARRELPMVRAIFGKWSSDALLALHVVPAAGFEELRRMLPGISPRVLSQKLRELERNGMVHREVLASRPPQVRYSLTDRGWTIAWLAQPVLLYLRITRREPVDPPSPGPSTAPSGGDGTPRSGP